MASWVIADFKTAAFKGIDDPLLPMYTAQLHGYAWIAKSLGMPEVAELALIYCEPCAGRGISATQGEPEGGWLRCRVLLSCPEDSNRHGGSAETRRARMEGVFV